MRAAIAGPGGEILNASDPGSAASAAATLVSVKAFFGEDWSDGDVAITNDVYLGAAHPTEFTAITPLYSAGRPAGWLLGRADFPDVGGWDLGGYTRRALDIWAEGVRIVPVKLVQGGRVRREMVEILRLNSRTARLSEACALALAAAARTTLHEWQRSPVSAPDIFEGHAQERRDLNAAAVASRLAALAPGAGVGRSRIAGVEPALAIECRVEIADRAIRVSFPAAPPPREQSINATRHLVTDAVISAVARHLACDNAATLGLLGACTVQVPTHTILDTGRSLPVGHARLTTCRAVEDAVGQALTALGIAASPARALRTEEVPPAVDAQTGTLSADRQRILRQLEAQLEGTP